MSSVLRRGFSHCSKGRCKQLSATATTRLFTSRSGITCQANKSSAEQEQSGKTNANVASAEQDYPPNSSIVPNVVNNRNPRNLEKLRIAEKATGWDLEKQELSFWHKLSLELTGQHVNAKIVHVFGRVPITASTNEWCIKKYLYSTKDLCAARTIGEVLAQRCLQAGITEVACFFSEEERKKEKVATILKAMEDGGVCLEEPPQMYVPWALTYPWIPEKSWEILEEDTELQRVEEAADILDALNQVKVKDRKTPKTPKPKQ